MAIGCTAGKLECWVEAFPSALANRFPYCEIKRPPKEKFELRVIVSEPTRASARAHVFADRGWLDGSVAAVGLGGARHGRSRHDRRHE